jgi:hypothetical protein
MHIHAQEAHFLKERAARSMHLKRPCLCNTDPSSKRAVKYEFYALDTMSLIRSTQFHTGPNVQEKDLPALEN